ncbi:MAG: hypothetical protein QOD53_1914, partial [Thermoleophilaceae bacterium]|nr:hypothetical protein [Thermoleophilaceae bacterium]
DAKSQFFLSLSQAAAILGPFILIGALVDVLVVEAGAVAVLLGVATLAIGRVQPRRFFWYGFAIFASVALYGAAFEGLRTINDPSVQPVGVVLKDGRGVPGLYVTETKDRLYLARVGHKEKAPTEPLHSDGRLFWVPRSEVQVYSVGPLQHIDRANDRAPQLVQELQDGISPGVSGGP